VEHEVASNEVIGLRNLVKELEESIRLRDEFLAGIAHDLKQPLSTIWTTIEFLVEATEITLPDYHQTALAASQRASRSAIELVEQLSIFRQLESGKLPSECGPLHLALEIQEAVESVEPQRQRSKVELKVAEVGMNTRAWADPRWLKRILVNLLSNAIKFTKDGVVTVSVENVDDNVHIRVQDNGPGIPPDKLEYIFEAYKRINTMGGEGIGLGLYLCHAFALEMNGDLTVESEVGKGSTFTLTLPTTPQI
jgi:signal transduction histidine kinase